MTSRYSQALSWLYGLESRGVKLGLDRVQAAAKLRGSPHKRTKFVHIAGSNGKGSVAAMMASCLRQAGYRTGQFSSPHLHRYIERVRVNGRSLRESEAAARLEELRQDTRLPRLTFFEYTTILAFEAFRDAECDVVLLEVGLGGRLDATNIVTPKLSVITSIGLEHQRILGDTLYQIAKEKAGIVKPGVPVIVGTRGASPRRAIARRADKLGAPVSFIDRDFAASWDDGRLHVRVGKERFEGLKLGLRGRHQADNAACAVAGLLRLKRNGFRVDESAIRQGLHKVRWPGRLEFHRGKPSFLFDAAHNAAGCAALAAYLDELSFKGPVVLLFSAMKDKDHLAMLRVFDPHVSHRVYAAPDVHRAAPARVFSKIRPGKAARSVEEGLQLAVERAGPNGLVVVAGSIFLTAEARALVKGVRSDPPIAM